MRAITIIGATILIAAAGSMSAHANTDYIFAGQACNAQTASHVTNFGSTDQGRSNESTTANSALYCEVLGYEDRDVDLDGGTIHYWDRSDHSTNGYLYGIMFAKEQDGTYTASGYQGSSSTAGGSPGFGTAGHTGYGYLSFSGFSAGSDVVTYGFYVVLPREYTSAGTTYTSHILAYQVNQAAD